MMFDRWTLLIIITFLIWGTQQPFLKMLSDELPPLLINLLRFSIALIVLAPLIVAQKTIPARKNFLKIGVLGVIGIALYGLLAVAGLHRSTAVNGSILLNTHPIIATAIAPLLVKEKFYLRGIPGILIGFFGMSLVVTNGFQFTGMLEARYLSGNLLLLLSAVCLAVYAVCSRFFVPQYGSLTTTFYAVLAGTLVLLAGAGITGEIFLIASVSLRHVLLLLYVAVMTTALTWVMWFKAIQQLGMFRAGTLFFLLPVSGVVSSGVILGERITGFTVLGTGLILTGIYMVQRSAKSD